MTDDDQLHQLYPAAFNDMRRPLQVGVHLEIDTALHAAVGRWVNHPIYLRNMIMAGARRIDLTGQVGGAVTDEQRYWAWKVLLLLRCDLVEWRERNKRAAGTRQPLIPMDLTEDEVDRECHLAMPRQDRALKALAEQEREEWKRWQASPG